MKYIVAKINGSQYKLEEGQELLIDYIGANEPKAEVLLSVDGDTVTIGKPFVEGISLGLKVLEPEVKGEKLYIYKFKAKSRYRRRTGFRPKHTKIAVEGIKESKKK